MFSRRILRNFGKIIQITAKLNDFERFLSIMMHYVLISEKIREIYAEKKRNFAKIYKKNAKIWKN